MTYYFIKNKRSGFVLDISGGVPSPGTKVIVWAKDETKDNQKWRFDASNGVIRSKVNENFVLDIQEYELIVNPYQAGKTDQRWTRSNDTIVNLDDRGFCLDLYNSGRDAGNPVIKYPFYGTPNQYWIFEAAS